MEKRNAEAAASEGVSNWFASAFDPFDIYRLILISFFLPS